MGDTEAMREALADAILSLRSEANLASRAGQHDRLHAIADSLNAASRAALAALPAPEDPPPFGSVPFGTMFIPGPAFLHGDNEWIDVPGPITVPPKPLADPAPEGLYEQTYAELLAGCDDLRMERDRLAEALAVAREALVTLARPKGPPFPEYAADALARIDTLTDPQGELT